MVVTVMYVAMYLCTNFYTLQRWDTTIYRNLCIQNNQSIYIYILTYHRYISYRKDVISRVYILHNYIYIYIYIYLMTYVDVYILHLGMDEL